MAVSDLDRFREQLPDVFEDRPLPPGWDDDWIIMPVDNPESPDIQEADFPTEELSTTDDLPPTSESREEFVWSDPFPGWRSPVSGQQTHPGAPQWQPGHAGSPPPDVLGFYLPFHYYHPTWWGIYLVYEGVAALAESLWRNARGGIPKAEAVTVARRFIYAHEAFHHATEAFALRLESTHRTPIYRRGFETLYRRHVGTDDSLEEALANAYALDRVMDKYPRTSSGIRSTLAKVLTAYVASQPPGYRKGMLHVRPAFANSRCRFAEDNHEISLAAQRRDPRLWQTFSNLFTGISRITSRTNYIVHRDSPIAKRMNLANRFLRYRDLRQRLETLGRCRVVRQGKGSHEIWERPDRHRFPVPRHPGDLRRGTLAKIIRQAGLTCSVSEFLSEEAVKAGV